MKSIFFDEIMTTNVVKFLQIIDDKKCEDSFFIITAEATTLLKEKYKLVDLMRKFD